MEAGKLRERISISAPITSINSIGQVVEGSPTIIANLWAAKWQLSSKDINKQAGVSEQAQAKFLIRYRPGITTKMRLTHKGKLYQITGTEEFEGGHGLFIFVRSVDAE